MPSRTTSTAMPSRRSPVAIERARTSKSSTTSTLTTVLHSGVCGWSRRRVREPGGMTLLQRCQHAGVSPVSVADTGLTPAVPYNELRTRSQPTKDGRPHERRNDRGQRAAQAVRADAGAGRHDLRGHPGQGDRLRRPERGRQVDHDPGDPRPRRPRRGRRPDRRAAATSSCGTRCATSARCSTRPPCSRAAPAATTCSGWPAPSA